MVYPVPMISSRFFLFSRQWFNPLLRPLQLLAVQPRPLYWFFALICCSIASSADFACAQQTESGVSSTTKRDFGYTIQSTYGVAIQTQGTKGYVVDAVAEMGILPNSFVKNAAGSGGVSITATGMTATGADGQMQLNLDPAKTRFFATLTNDPAKLGTASTSSSTSSLAGSTAQGGSASISATGVATTSFTVESSESIQSNSFRRDF